MAAMCTFPAQWRENDTQEVDHDQLCSHLNTALKTDMAWKLGSPRELSGKSLLPEVKDAAQGSEDLPGSTDHVCSTSLSHRQP